jgi:hypothetical protein
MSTLTDRGACGGYKCSCQRWVPVAETLRDLWPSCQNCPHTGQTHRKLAPPRVAAAA